jgi:cell shape-determining protein MreD
VRHKLARFVALTIFSLSMIFQFVQFLLSGILGSPTSVVQIVVNGLVVFLLFSRFDFEKQSYKKH